MLSIICVFNNHEKLSECLLNSIGLQTSACDLVLVDNTRNEFANASSALNHGASKAKGDFFVFVHQDVVLYGSSWIADVEGFLINLKTFGWAGVAGVTEEGQLHGFVKDSNSLLWTQYGDHIEVQTLDEVVLICKRREDGKYFDENVPGWHAYGAEACLSSNLNGQKNYSISFPVWHNSNRSNNQGLSVSHNYLRKKFRGKVDLIYTTCGSIRTSSVGSGISRKLKRLNDKLFRRIGLMPRINGFWDVMNEITSDFETITCYYAYIPHECIVAESFTQFPTYGTKVVRHCFTGINLEESVSDCVVFETNVAEEIADKKSLLDSLLIDRQVIVCTDEASNDVVLGQLNQHYNIETRKTVRAATGGYGMTIFVSQISAL